jgi:glycosyltransferase involved in cell wall biosynthesis
MFKKFVKSLVGRSDRTPDYPVIIRPSSQAQTRGRVLLSYLEYPLRLPDDDPLFLGHSNNWESRAIADIFLKLGYQVEAINFSDRAFEPVGKFDVIFDIYANLGRLAPVLEKDTVKYLHCSGSDPYYQNAAELKRVLEVNRRRNGSYSPKRVIAEPEWTYKSLDAADACSLIGNEHTRRTYPEKYWQKMELVTVSASEIGAREKIFRNHVPEKREFLWFFGSGAVHKGLDLLLEVFAKHPQLQLHIVGNIASEKDFFEIYKKELTATENIHFHGFLLPTSRKFQGLLKDIFCFVAPSCSEGISPSVVTCLRLGLFPIISRDTGVTLPEGCGLMIENLTTAEIEKHILNVMGMEDDEILLQTHHTQDDAWSRYSRSAFYRQMESFIHRKLAMM